jgi:hypothetical protein
MAWMCDNCNWYTADSAFTCCACGSPKSAVLPQDAAENSDQGGTVQERKEKMGLPCVCAKCGEGCLETGCHNCKNNEAIQGTDPESTHRSLAGSPAVGGSEALVEIKKRYNELIQAEIKETLALEMASDLWKDVCTKVLAISMSCFNRAVNEVKERSVQ